MFILTLIFSLFVSCLSYNVYVRNASTLVFNDPIPFKVNEGKVFTCVAQQFNVPITYQWLISRVGYGSNYTIPKSNFSTTTITFNSLSEPPGYISCQAKGRFDNRFYNSTNKVPFYVVPKSGPSSSKKVWISNYSPIHFRVNVTKKVSCKTSGFNSPLYYQWINVSDYYVFAAGNVPEITLKFKQRIKKGAIQCTVKPNNDPMIYASQIVRYYVSGQVMLTINFLLIAVMVGISFTFFQKEF